MLNSLLPSVPPFLPGSCLHPYHHGSQPSGRVDYSFRGKLEISDFYSSLVGFLLKATFFAFRQALIDSPLFLKNNYLLSKYPYSFLRRYAERLPPRSTLIHQSSICNPKSKIPDPTRLRLPYMRAIIHSTFSLTHPRQSEKLKLLCSYPTPLKLNK
jgi:hypothetical protein